MQVLGNQVEITGYQARRSEFEPEYDNAAEAMVADLDFKEDDTEVRNLQLAVLLDEFWCAGLGAMLRPANSSPASCRMQQLYAWIPAAVPAARQRLHHCPPDKGCQ